jgi:acid stress chaperone HdeB
MSTAGKSMRRALFIASAMFIPGVAVPAKAQVVVEMSRITCGQFIDYSFDRQEVIGAWMSGFFNASQDRKILDITRYQENSKRVSDYCKKHRKEPLMSAIQRSTF